MAKLTLCFMDKKEDRALTQKEIMQVSLAAAAARSLAQVMAHYAADYPKTEDPQENYIHAFEILEWLLEPVTDFLRDQGEDAAPEGAGEAANE